MAVTGVSRQKYLTEIYRKANILLEESESDYLLNAMKEYTLHKSVEKLMRALLICLDTPEKLDLLKDIRYLIPKLQVHEYDSLAPYSSMAHPVLPTVNYKNDPIRIRVHSDGSNFSQRIDSPSGKQRTTKAGVMPIPAGPTENKPNVALKRLLPSSGIVMDKNGGLSSFQGKTGEFRVLTFTRDGRTDENLGFTIKGGKENDAGIYVGSVRKRSPADNIGLEENDQIIEVNGISFDHIALSPAAKLLSSLSRLKMVVRTGTGIHSPHMSDLQHFDPWNLSASSSHSSGSNYGSDFTGNNFSSSNGILKVKANNVDKGTESVADIDGVTRKERKVRIVIDLSSTKDIGFNLRGGSEYGLGLYVSSVDPDSLAERSGLQFGDQILSANGLSFEKIKHKDAVNFLKSNKDIVLIVKSVGKIPETQCVFSEFSWLTPDGARIPASNRNSKLASSMPAASLKHHRDIGIDSTDIPFNATISDFRSSKESVGVQTPDLTIPADALDIESRHEDRQTPLVDDLSPRNHESNAPSPINGKVDSLRTSPVLIEGAEKVLEAVAVKTPSPVEENTNDEACETVLSSLDSALQQVQTIDSDPPLEVPPAQTEVAVTYDTSISESVSNNNLPLDGMNNFEVKAGSPPEKGKGVKKEQRSKSFLQKQGEKLKEKFSLRRKSKSVDRDLLNSHLFERQRSSHDVLLEIREKAQVRLADDDYNLLIKCIKHYLEKGDIELFSTQVIEILDTASKAELLKDIREIVFPYDVSRYDVRIAKREIEHLEELGYGAEPQIFEGAISDKPPRRTIVKAVQEKGGKFQLKSKEEAEQLEKEKEMKSKNPSKIYFQTKSILERDRTIRKYSSFHKIPQPSSEYAAPFAELSDELNQSPSAEEIEAMYAKVDMSAKRNRHLEEDQSNVYDTFDNDVEVIRNSGDRPPTEGATASKDEYDSGSDEDDGYSLPYFKRPAGAASQKINGPAITRRKIIIEIPKTHQTLGISISGGSGSIAQPVVLIDNIFPGGAASDIRELRAGQQIISVDGQSLDNATHAEAVDIIRGSYNDKSKPKMEVEVYID